MAFNILQLFTKRQIQIKKRGQMTIYKALSVEISMFQ